MSKSNLLLLVLVFFQSAIGQTIKRYDGFEDYSAGTTNVGYWIEQNCSTNPCAGCAVVPFQVSTEQARCGYNSVKMMKKGDDAALTGGNYCGYRTQFSNYNDAFIDYNDHAWIGFSVYIANHQLTDQWSKDNVWIFQVKNIDAGGGGNQYGSIKTWCPSGNGIDYQFYVEGLGNIGEVPVNRWVDFAVHVYYNTGSTGKVEVWRDGQKYTYNGALPAKDKCYLAWDIYSDKMKPESPTNTVYFDEIRFLDDVASTNHYDKVKAGSETNSIIKAGDVIWLKATVNSKYVCADKSINSTEPLYANSTSAGAWEEFEVKEAGSGWFRLYTLATSKYVMSNQNADGKLQANDGTGSWEEMKFIYNSDGTISLKYEINSKYVSAEDYGNGQLVANRSIIGECEKFTWGKTLISTDLTSVENKANTLVLLSPNPVNGNMVEIDEQSFVSIANYKIFNSIGQLVQSNILDNSSKVSIEINANLSNGVYIVLVSDQNHQQVDKLILSR